jgi:hypothetical protein
MARFAPLSRRSQQLRTGAYTKQPFGQPFGRMKAAPKAQVEKPKETIADVIGRGGAVPTEQGIGTGAGIRIEPVLLGGRGGRRQRVQQGGVGGIGQSTSFEVSIPIQGINKAFAVEMQSPTTCGDMLNVRPKDVLERRVRIGKRPGMAKAYSQQISSNINFPVVRLLQIITVE